ncbi:pyridoxine 5'-phosphate synthase [Magnetofaba australis]|nr:pyridoxine 5'-phosphate synthase [Magnetofaba australis]
MIQLGVNIDHVATVRQARGGRNPDIVEAGQAAERGGADGITIHLREDRRHIQEEDLARLTRSLRTRINLEMAATDEMCEIALKYRPADCCIVPEKRAELTTEGGLNVAGQLERIRDVTQRLLSGGIRVSLFIDPELEQISAAYAAGAPVIELHTGRYADAETAETREKELAAIQIAAHQAHAQGIIVHAGHGLDYHTVQPIAAIPSMQELNIGHAIVARSLMWGMEESVRRMKALMREAAQ